MKALIKSFHMYLHNFTFLRADHRAIRAGRPKGLSSFVQSFITHESREVLPRTQIGLDYIDKHIKQKLY